ncbi:MAG TPA: tetratricopeptide repeat protein, partial [Burkholderiales bacterium]|nr:tetratricopeptide repeat protein [Burkholderiales bacterium]
RLETEAADGLVNLAALVQHERPDEAAALIEKAIRLAEQRSARRTLARARLQLANVRHVQNRNEESLPLVESELPFLRTNRYRRFELQGLSIKTRVLQSLDRLDEASGFAKEVLSLAEAVNDEAQMALAQSNLASVLTALGHYPEALRHRQRVEEIRTRQGDREALPYDMSGRADVLIRLGRFEEADRLLYELERAVEEGTPSYLPVSARVAFLRAQYLATLLQCHRVGALLERVRSDKRATGSAPLVAPAIGSFCDARMKRPSQAVDNRPFRDVDPTFLRERQYWRGAAALERGDAAAALHEVKEGLALLGAVSNEELRWRLAAVGAVASAASGDDKLAAEMLSSARAALNSVKSAWGQEFGPYDQRPDLLYLKKRSGLT